MKKLFNTKIIICTALAVLTLSACKQKKPEITQDTISIELTTPSQEDALKITQATQTWHVTNKKICVVLGYNFNSEQSLKSLKETLANRYGLSEDGGLIQPVVFPDDFKHNGKAYVSELTALLNDPENDFSGVIILGAPEGTHLVLARMQDFWEMHVPYPVFVIFPQDDVLGLESTADFVLDRSHSAEIIVEHEESEDDEELLKLGTDILTRAIDYMIASETPLPRDTTLQLHLEQLLNGYTFKHYVDPETSIQAINHFVLN